MIVEFTVNGKTERLEVSPTETLVHILREKLYLTGTKEGCGQGDCGACSVWFNGKIVNSCLIWAGKLQDANIVTIEGLGSLTALHPIQECFIEAGAIQCGYCTPGMIMAVYALLKENPDPDEKEIRTAISGNLCRCTGYNVIIEAVKKAAEYFKEHREVSL